MLYCPIEEYRCCSIKGRETMGSIKNHKLNWDWKYYPIRKTAKTFDKNWTEHLKPSKSVSSNKYPFGISSPFECVFINKCPFRISAPIKCVFTIKQTFSNITTLQCCQSTQGSKKPPSGRPGQVHFPFGQVHVTFSPYLPHGQGLRQAVRRLNCW